MSSTEDGVKIAGPNIVHTGCIFIVGWAAEEVSARHERSTQGKAHLPVGVATGEDVDSAAEDRSRLLLNATADGTPRDVRGAVREEVAGPVARVGVSIIHRLSSRLRTHLT